MKKSARKYITPPAVKCANCKALDCANCIDFDKFAFSESIMDEYIRESYMTMTDKEIAKALMVPKHIVYYRRSRISLKSGAFKECDDDCFNCPYPDCIKPYRLCTTLKDVEEPTGGER